QNQFFHQWGVNPFIWNEIHIIAKSRIDCEGPQEFMEVNALDFCELAIETGKTSEAECSSRFEYKLDPLSPSVYVSLAETGIDLILRYLTGIRRRRASRDQICREVLRAFEGEPHVHLVSPTRKGPTEIRLLSGAREVAASIPGPEEANRD